ncbi:hypothetical protein [Streptomyces sp. bgisy153]|uniref:hypothetical protein n=1 Tax=Streptomyces sp. bgisy153 TaxID=3413793 RepID=UPI003D70B15D
MASVCRAAGRDGTGRRGRLRAGTALIARGEFSIVMVGPVGVLQDRLGALVAGYCCCRPWPDL